MTTNATWQTMKPEVSIVSCAPQCLQMKTLPAGDRNIFCKKIAGRIESKSTETSCWHDGHLAIFLSREGQLWTTSGPSCRLESLVADEKVTNPSEDSSKVLFEVDSGSTKSGRLLKSKNPGNARTIAVNPARFQSPTRHWGIGSWASPFQTDPRPVLHCTWIAVTEPPCTSKSDEAPNVLQ